MNNQKNQIEVRINKEIRDYTESMFFGLSLRQFIFSVLACGVAVGIYLGLKPMLGTETTSWLCIVAAFPFALMGFVKYNGLTAEKFLWVWFKAVFLTPKVLTFGNTNYYYEIMANSSPKSAKKRQLRLKRKRAKGRRRMKGADEK